MKKTLQILFILILLILPFSQVNAQGWVPVGQPMLGDPAAAIEFNGELYVAHVGGTTPADSSMVTIEKWNGIFWTYFASNHFHYIPEITSMAFYNNELFLGGMFDPKIPSDPIKSHRNGIVRYDGNTWMVPDSGIFRHSGNPAIYDIEVYKGKLYAAGWFEYAGTDSAYSIAEWNGSNWSYVGSSPTTLGFIGSVYDLQIFNDSLYVGGAFINLSTNSAASLFIWDGSNWSTPFVPSFNDNHVIRRMHVFNDSLIVCFYNRPTTKVYILNNGGWYNTIDTAIGRSFNHHIYVASHHDTLWVVSGRTTSTTKSLFYLNGSRWEIAPDQLLSNYSYSYPPILFTFNSKLHIIRQDEKKFVYQLSENVGIIKGTIYADTDKNCTKSWNEKPLDALLKITPGPYFTKMYNNGEYVITFPPGNYDIEPHLKYYEVNNCQPQTRNISITSNIVIDSQDFAMSPIPGIRDLRTAITGNSSGKRARQGFTESYILYFNQYTPDTVSNIVVYLEHDSNVILDTAYIPYDTYQNNILKWNIGQIDPNANSGNNRIFIKFKVPLSTSLGDTVKFFARILPAAGDTVPENNYDTLIQVVAAAIDPNDKQSNPEGEIKKTTKKIDYLIRFQNTGTDTAYRVVVVDTIDTNLPLTEVEMNSSSHPYKLEVQNNVLIWHFYNILLPDSHVNEPESHGFIRYTAGIRPGLAEGDSIINRAYIYFDYQKPIITNTVMSKVESPVGIKDKDEKIFLNGFSIYPNPTSGNLTISRENADLPAEIKVYSTTGALIHTSKWQAHSTQSNINLADLAPGLYLLRISQPNGVVTKRVIVNK